MKLNSQEFIRRFQLRIIKKRLRRKDIKQRETACYEMRFGLVDYGSVFIYHLSFNSFRRLGCISHLYFFNFKHFSGTRMFKFLGIEFDRNKQANDFLMACTPKHGPIRSCSGPRDDTMCHMMDGFATFQQDQEK